MDMLIDSVQKQEHSAWVQMFNKISEMTNIPKEELNKGNFREMFGEIERLGWFNHKRIEIMKELGEWKEDWNSKGLFWKGD